MSGLTLQQQLQHMSSVCNQPHYNSMACSWLQRFCGFKRYCSQPSGSLVRACNILFSLCL